MAELMGGEVPDALSGAFLAALQTKGVTGQELAAFARVMRSNANRIDLGPGDLVDTCGTGGGRSTFNLSTASAIVAAAAGAKVAKHGNRAVTSKCGSADVLEALGIPIEGDADTLRQRFERYGLVFLFAPAHHPAVRHVGSVRRTLGIQTVFNVLGPLANPAGAKRQVVGVSSEAALRPMAQALFELGTELSYVVRGEDGLDEVSPVATTRALKVSPSGIEEATFAVTDFGLATGLDAALVPGGTVEENAAIVTEAVSDAASPRAECLVPNVALTLMAAGLAENLADGAAIARQTVSSGRARDLLAALKEKA